MVLKKLMAICLVLLTLAACGTENIPEPDRCAICDDLPRHAPCIVNLSTGELLELDMYEPHPTLVAEIADVQSGGYFSFVRGAGVEGYKLGAESVTITIPIKNERMEQRHFCIACRQLLSAYEKDGYVLVDLKNAEQPVVYSIDEGVNFSVRCYEVSVKLLDESNEYEITVLGTYNHSGE